MLTPSDIGGSKKFALVNAEQRTDLANLIRRIIALDCTNARIDAKKNEKKAGQDKKIITPDLQRLRDIDNKGIEVREAFYRQLIKDMGERGDEPIPYTHFFAQCLSSFERSLADDDPSKKDYMFLLTGLTPAKDLPEKIKQKAASELPEGIGMWGGFRIPLEKGTPEYLSGVKSRSGDIMQSIHNVLDAFYEAVTSKAPENPLDPDYMVFADLANNMLGLNDISRRA